MIPQYLIQPVTILVSEEAVGHDCEENIRNSMKMHVHHNDKVQKTVTVLDVQKVNLKC